MERNFTRWECGDECQIQGMTPENARDLIIKCFFEAQKETFSRAKKTLSGKMADDEELHKSIKAAVRLAFKDAGGDFEHPTKAHLSEAVQLLAKKAAIWGTPADIIEYHKKQMTMIMTSLA